MLKKHKDVFACIGVMDLEPIIELKNLSKTFGSGEGQVAALKNVSVSVEKCGIFSAYSSPDRGGVP